MTDQLGPSFDKRLRAELDRFRPPTPSPEMARFGLMPAPSRWLVALKPAIAVGAALALLSVAASAASGSPNPGVWQQRAVTTVEELTQSAPPSPTPEQVKSPAAQPQPAHPQPSETPEPNRESPEPSSGTGQEPSESPESSYIDGPMRYQSYPKDGAIYQGGSDA
jgi:hypothetical protein